jgi:Flp pilus assembly protein TadD
MKRGRTLQAIEEFETAARLESEPEGRIYFRLGVAYASDGRTSRAREALRRAAELGPPLIRQLALQELKKLAPENDKQ